jgi:hypothetical protein
MNFIQLGKAPRREIFPMNTRSPVYPAHIVVSRAEVRLVADEAANATPATIKSGSARASKTAQVAEAAEAKTSSVDLVA